MLRTAHGALRIDRQQLPDHELVEQHAYGRQVLLHRGGREAWLQGLYVGRNMDRLDVPKLANIAPLAPTREFHGGARIGTARVRIPYIGSEELNEASRRVRIGCGPVTCMQLAHLDPINKPTLRRLV
jgi:hypothetical protein